LEAQSWNGKAAGVVCLQLRTDNKGVDSARLVLLGAWGEGAVAIQAARIFPQLADDIKLEVDCRDLGMFRFRGNEMASELVESGSIRHCFVRMRGSERQVLDGEELEGPVIFCMKAAAAISKGSSAKHGLWLTVTLQVFAGAADDVLEAHALAADPAWPGVRFRDGDVPLIPKAGAGTALIGGKTWGSPVAPLVVPGGQWDESDEPLDGSEVAAAIGGLLNSGILPDVATTLDGLRKKWEKATSAADLRKRKAEKLWPVGKPQKKG
jgi:hypothetical protein